jgi:hypothetical protein
LSIDLIFATNLQIINGLRKHKTENEHKNI